MDKRIIIIVAIIAVVVIALVAFVILVTFGGLALWQLGAYSAAPYEETRATGFDYIRVLDGSIQYDSDGELSFTVMNVVGSRVEDVEFYFAGDCEGEMYEIDSLYAGDNAIISVDCEPKLSGNTFATGIGITYTVSVSGITHQDSGIIMGTVG